MSNNTALPTPKNNNAYADNGTSYLQTKERTSLSFAGRAARRQHIRALCCKGNQYHRTSIGVHDTSLTGGLDVGARLQLEHHALRTCMDCLRILTGVLTLTLALVKPLYPACFPKTTIQIRQDSNRKQNCGVHNSVERLMRLGKQEPEMATF